MKSIVKKEIGSDGAAAELLVGEGKLAVQVSYPIEKLVAPITEKFGELVDKLEELIPGDQKAMAAEIKAKAQAELVEFLGESIA